MSRPSSRSFFAAILLALLAPSAAFAQAVYGSNSDPHDFVSFPNAAGGPVALFRVDPPAPPYRTQLWRTDGTSAGSYRINSCDDCRIFTERPMHDGFFFDALVGPGDLPARKTFLWSDSTREGTRLMPPPPQRVNDGFTLHHAAPDLGVLLFLTVDDSDGSDSLWAWDGSPTPPVRLLTPATGGYHNVFTYIDAGGLTYFGTHDRAGEEYHLWVTDGTAGGTRRLGPIPPYSPLFATGDAVVVLARPEDCRLDIVRADADAPPSISATLPETICSIDALDGRTINGTLYFTAKSSEHDHELWATDGTASGTRRLTDFGERFPIISLMDAISYGDRTFFTVVTSQGSSIWSTDGTRAGTAPLGTFCDADCYLSSGLSVVGGQLSWPQWSEGTGQVWLSDGTTAGSHPAGLLPPEGIDALIWDEDRWFVFTERDDREEFSLQTSPTEPVVFREIATFPYQGLRGNFVWHHALAGDLLVFGGYDDFHGTELWVSDGTGDGTHLLLDIARTGTATEPPGKPTIIRAEPEDGRVRLSWRQAGDEPTVGTLEVEARSPGEDWRPVLEVPSDPLAGVGGGLIEDLEADTPYTFRLREVNAGGASPWSEPISARTYDGTEHDFVCTPSEERLCFQGDRFGIKVSWWNQHHDGPVADVGQGHRAPGIGDGRSAYMWFFRQDNVELVLKMLDGFGVNGHAWLFYGALSDVEYWVTVFDYDSRLSRTYHNPPGEICGLADTEAFVTERSVGSAVSTPLRGILEIDVPEISRTFEPSHPVEPCVPDETTLCLLDGRFAVTVDWRDHHNQDSGVGGAIAYTDRTGFFWFFRQDNVELVVKALDGRAANGKFWLFYGALTDVGYTLKITDTATGHDFVEYSNPPGNVCGGADTSAF